MQLSRNCHVVSSQLEPTWTLILVSSLLLARGIASLGALNSSLCDKNDSYPGCRAWTVRGQSRASSVCFAIPRMGHWWGRCCLRGIASLGALTALAASMQHGRKPFLYTVCSQTIPPLDRFSSFCPAAS